MACANDVARSNNPNPQFVIIFWRHASNAMSILRNQRPLMRAKFDRTRELGVQDSLDQCVGARQLTRLFFLRSYHVRDL
jgi:hypothetical protein